MRLRSLLILFSAATIFCVMLPGSLLGQLGMATLGGTVTDPSGAIVPRAEVTLKSTTRKEERKSVTNSAGQYVFSALLPGSYELTVTAAGFQGKTIGGIVLASGQGSTLNVSLSVSATKQQVTVTAAPPLLQSTTATVGSVVGSQQFESLPMVHRNFTSILATLPAVAVVVNPSTFATSGALGDAVNPSIMGQRQRDNNYLLDGVENTQPLFGKIGLFPPPEAIAEMKVESGPDSGAVGWASGATINIVTKSGTNHYHGDVWDYLQNNGLDARSFFQIGKLPVFHYNQFGGAAGGPLMIPHLLSRNKAWYVFGYYEGIRIPSASTYTTLVPTEAQLNGNLSGGPQIYDPYTTVLAPDGSVASRQAYLGNIITPSEINTSAQNLLKAWYPAPNYPYNSQLDINYLRRVPSNFHSDQWSVRTDHQFGSKDTFYARYSDWRTTSTGGSFPGITGLSYNRDTNVAVGDTHVLNPTSVVTGRFGLERVPSTSSNLMAGDLAKKFGFLTAFPPFQGQYDVLPGLYMDDQQFPGIGETVSNNGPQNYWSATADSQLIRSRHTLGFGFGWIRTTITTGHTFGYEDFDAPQTAFGPGTGSGLASFLLGVPTDAFSQQGNQFGSFFGNEFSLYAQDTFRTTKKLTLSLGLRWDYAQTLQNRFGLGTYDWVSGKYYWDQTNPITHQPANIQPGGVPPDYNGFQPRIGIAYMFNPKTVVRSSFGIFDDLFGITAQANSSEWGNWPFSFPNTVSGLNPGLPTAFITNPFPGPAVGTPTPSGINQGLNVERSSSRNPYVEEWSLSVQRQLTPSTMLQVAYFGSHGVKMSGQMVDNTALVPGTTPLATRQRWPQWPVYVLNNYNEFSSWYDGLSTELKKRFSHNLSLQVSYSWAHALSMEDASSIGSTFGVPAGNPTRFNSQDFKGPAGYDIRHIFSAGYTYNIPFRPGNMLARAVLGNWELSGIVSADSGVPFWVALPNDNENIGWAGRHNEFPNITCNPGANWNPTISEWFNTACYQVPTYGTAGNAGRKGLTADGLFNWDSAFVKKWPFGEGRNVQFRAEFFDFPNNHTFAPPHAYPGQSSFGKVSSVRGTQAGLVAGRVIQFALKIHF